MQNLSYENEFCMQFDSLANQLHFHKNGFALRVALKQRHKGTRKGPIQCLQISRENRVVTDSDSIVNIQKMMGSLQNC